ncbi:MFS transporter [Hymenobacter volaticus]|uniref:MFS transporter n=1 Tax=Hymenobacter volaticus TaxID=2932254 RepID=A0ABY4G584_9BACT|nr:MFS transporter [Hymenobacter volaticus]UOQ65973.1 MFS transporter [Hymenobacter volaticus]
MITTEISENPTAQRARIAIALFFFLSGFGFSTWASRIPTIQSQLSLDEAQLGGVLFALPTGLMLTLPVTSILLQRFNSRQVMLVGAVLYNVALALLGFAQETWQLVALLFCFGCSRNLLNISVNAQSVGVQALYDRSIIASFHGVWSVAGFAAAAVGSGLVAAGVLPKYHFLVVAVVLTAVAIYFFPNTLDIRPDPEKRKTGFSLPDKTLLKFGIIAFASMACEGTMYDWSGIYFEKAVHMSKETATIGFAVYMVAMTTGRFSGDWLANRYGVKPMLHYSGLLMTCGLGLAALVPVPLVAGLGFVLVGLGVSCVIPMVFSMAGRTSALSSGSAIAAVSMVGYFGFLVVPPVVGFVAKAANLRWSFGLVALLGAVVVALVQRVREPEPQVS